VRRAVFDLDAYLQRIGLHGRPGLAEVHRAHGTSIPFENLDPHRGLAVSLQPDDLQEKMVGRRRGGYCFEQNLLLKAALEALGADVELYLARVRYGAPPGTIRPRGHLVLRVNDGAGDWHADVGFGLGTLFEPIPFGPGEEHEQLGWRYRVVREGEELVLQTLEAEEWSDMYAFHSAPVPPVDVETVNWWVCTHPRSPFVTGLVAALQHEDGTRIALSDWNGLTLSERGPDSGTVTPLQIEQVPGVLAERFRLPGFAVGAGGRVVAEE
jgi:N-hydroxyarylamine O-acetyltransferase